MKPYTRQDHCLTIPADQTGAVLIEPCNVNTNLQKWQLIMQDVLSLIVSENASSNNRKSKRKRTTSKRMNKILLQKPTEKSTLLNDIFLF